MKGSLSPFKRFMNLNSGTGSCHQISIFFSTLALHPIYFSYIFLFIFMAS